MRCSPQHGGVRSRGASPGIGCQGRVGISCFSGPTGPGVSRVSGAPGSSQPWGSRRGRDIPWALGHPPRPGSATLVWEGKLRQGGGWARCWRKQHQKRGPVGGSPPSSVGEPHPALPARSQQRFGMLPVPVHAKGRNGHTGHGDGMSPQPGHPAIGQGLCPRVEPSWGVTRGPWGPSPSRLASAARGLPGFPWRPAAFSLSPFFLRFPISRSHGPAGSRPRRGAAGRGERRGGAAGGHPGASRGSQHPMGAKTRPPAPPRQLSGPFRAPRAAGGET